MKHVDEALTTGLKASQSSGFPNLQVHVAPHETLFEVGESSNPGIFIVLEGQLGVFLPEGDQLRHSNTHFTHHQSPSHPP